MSTRTIAPARALNRPGPDWTLLVAVGVLLVLGTLLVWSATLGLVMGIPGAIFTWRWPEPVDLALLAAMGVLGTITQGCYIKGMAIGDAAAMAPIDYIRLVFTVLVGVTLFHEIPTIWTIAGAGVVVASTLLITWREAALNRAARKVSAGEEAAG